MQITGKGRTGMPDALYAMLRAMEREAGRELYFRVETVDAIGMFGWDVLLEGEYKGETAKMFFSEAMLSFLEETGAKSEAK